MKILFLPSLFGCLLILACVSPINKEPVQWQSVIDLPLMNKQFYFGKVLNQNTDSTITLKGFNDSLQPDTLSFIYSDTTSSSVSQNLFQFSPVSFNQKVGKITLSTTDTVSTLFKLDSLPVPVPVPGAIPIADSTNKVVPGVYSVVFDSTCPDLPLTVHNNSGITLTNVDVQIIDHGTVVANDTIASIPPNSQAVAMVPVQGKSMDSIITLNIHATLQGGSGAVLNPGDGLYVGFSLKGMTISHAYVDDTIAALNNQYLQPMTISDTVNVSYLDIALTVLGVTLTNGVNASFSVTAEWLNLWDRNECKNDSVFNFSSIGRLSTDSVYSRALLMDTTLIQGLSTTTKSLGASFVRLFPVWNVAQTGSRDSALMSTFAFTIRLVSEKQRITIDENDTVSLHVVPGRTAIQTIAGVTRYPISSTGGQVSKPINLPGISNNNTLRGHLMFNGALLTGTISLAMNQPSTIDTCALMLNFSTPAPNPVRDTVTIGLDSLRNSAQDSFSRDISPLLNAFPDTLSFIPTTLIPKGSNLVFYPIIAEDSSTNTFSIGARVSYGIRLPLTFSVTDTAQVFITDSVRISGGTLNVLHRVNVSEAALIYAARNTTVLSLRVFGIGAPQTSKQALFNLTTAEMNPAIVNQQFGSELFNLTGDSGLIVLPNDSLKNDSIVLTENDFAKFTSADTLYMRWRLVFLPVNQQAVIRSNDFVKINASVRTEGVQNMDSLLHAGNSHQ